MAAAARDQLANRNPFQTARAIAAPPQQQGTPRPAAISQAATLYSQRKFDEALALLDAEASRSPTSKDAF